MSFKVIDETTKYLNESKTEQYWKFWIIKMKGYEVSIVDATEVFGKFIWFNFLKNEWRDNVVQIDAHLIKIAIFKVLKLFWNSDK